MMEFDETIKKVRGSEMNITTLGIDIAKQVFQLHGTDGHGKVTLTKRLRRNQLLRFMQQLPPCLVGMEACAGAIIGQKSFRVTATR